MLLLLLATLIWAFSFGIIKQFLAGVPADAVAFARLLIALGVFAPFFRFGSLGMSRPKLTALGGVQFGLMYVLYQQSFATLAAWQVAAFTAFTPLWVIALEAVIGRDRSLVCGRFWGAVLLSVAGAWLVQARAGEGLSFGIGFYLVQAANFCFAFGQVAYRRLLGRKHPLLDLAAHPWMYLGGVVVTYVSMLVLRDEVDPDPFASLRGPEVGMEQIASLVYLGVIAAGVGFACWNAGARRVRPQLLAVANNLKVPAAIAVSVLVFGESFAPESGDANAVAKRVAGILMILLAFALASARPSKEERLIVREN